LRLTPAPLFSLPTSLPFCMYTPAILAIISVIEPLTWTTAICTASGLLPMALSEGR
jgi:hypothetical protein